MATTTITNTSNQVIPVLVGSTTLAEADPNSSIPPLTSEQVAIASGAQLVIETGRVDIGQLEQLRRKRLITYTSF
jgi:hypothetical protein